MAQKQCTISLLHDQRLNKVISNLCFQLYACILILVGQVRRLVVMCVMHASTSVWLLPALFKKCVTGSFQATYTLPWMALYLMP